ncbi:MAG: DNA-binding protein [Oscillatoriales cyanobacterium CG2_30_40_61]|nr:MAG: DNA-binding protein [Oscillatoriales cyanobacterium CG2_30_40_61]
MKKLVILALSTVVINCSFAAKAQVPINSLQQRERTVTISGTVQSVVGNQFTLNDDTGEVIVDAGPRWYHTINVSPGEKLTVTGEYDDDNFDAFQITRANGETIIIRNSPGRPPWAGGRKN